MTQKQILIRVLDFAELPFAGDPSKAAAARAYCVIAWLHDMNWHVEARVLEARAESVVMNAAFRRLAEDTERTAELEYIASLMAWIYGQSLAVDDWRGLEDAELVAELWNIINGTPSRSGLDPAPHKHENIQNHHPLLLP